MDEYARQFGIHPDQMRQLFMNFDDEYLFTMAASTGVKVLSAQLADPDQQARLVLGNSVSNFAQSAGLVAKYYSLGAQLDEEGNVVAISRERALADMLDLADQRARELINLVGADEAVIPIMYYEAARLQRQGAPEEQLNALELYWSSATLAQVQAYLAGITGQ